MVDVDWVFVDSNGLKTQRLSEPKIPTVTETKQHGNGFYKITNIVTGKTGKWIVIAEEVTVTQAVNPTATGNTL